MIVIVILNLSAGAMTVEVERVKAWNRWQARRIKSDDRDDDWDPRTRLFVPLESRVPGKRGAVVLVEPGLRIYDLGRWTNWRWIMGEGWAMLWPWSAGSVRLVVSCCEENVS
jgi:hypothetical protein